MPGTQEGATTSSQSGPGGNDIAGEHEIRQIYRTKALPFDAILRITLRGVCLSLAEDI